MTVGFDDTGRGEPVVLLHSSCYSRRQWGPLIKALRGRYRSLALDLSGYGATPFPAHPESFEIGDEVALVEQVMDRVDGPVHVVGHSYGGAVALAVALRHPTRVHSVAVHEPVAFQLAKRKELADVDAEVTQMVATLVDRLAANAPAEAASYFIDYWRGEGTWAALPEKGREAAARVIAKLPIEFDAILGTPYGLGDYGTLPMPILLTAGTTGRSAGRRVTELLASALGEATLHRLPGVGHMAPVVNPDLVNPHVLAHLEAHPIRSVPGTRDAVS